MSKNGKPPILLAAANNLTPLPGATMTKNAYGIDVLSRKFSCPRSKVASSVPAKGSADIFYPNLRATGNYSVQEGEGLLTEIMVEYKGLLGGFLPDPLITYSLGSGSASGTDDDPLIDPEDQRSVSAIFTSPSCEWKYISQSPVLAPTQYFTGASPYIISYEALDKTGARRSGWGRLRMVYESYADGLTCSQVPGTPFFEVSEKWKSQIKFVPPTV